MKRIFVLIILSIYLSPKNSFSSKCIAHRGNNIDHIENTLNSFLSAYKIGADGIELDIQHTKDGHAIIFHDKRLRRLVVNKYKRKCPRRKKIKNLNLSQIIENCQYKDGQEILTLKKFLQKSRSWNIEFFIEFKDKPSTRTLELIRNHFVSFEKIKFISFKNEALIKTHNFLFMKTNRSKNYLKLYYFWIPSKPKWSPNVPVRSYWLFSKRILRLNKYYSMGMWVIDDEDSINRAKKNGVEFITTNDPKLCLNL